jgi:D-xylose transport system substrate-binding protein
MQFRKTIALASVAAAAGLVAAGCGSSSKSSTSGSSTTGASSGTNLTVSSFTNNFSAMNQLKPVAAKGKGNVAVILPDTVSSARYTEFDAPYLTKALQTAGLSSSQFTVQNAQGSDATELTDAQAAITGGASVLIFDPLDSGVGASIESYAKSHGVAAVDYDRLTLGGSRQYYVSFDNVKVGQLMGNGLISCAQQWGVTNPQAIVMKGSPTDNNATLFAQGYDGVLAPKFNGGGWTEVAQPAGTWDPPTAQTEFQQAYTAHPNINAALIPNDDNAAPIISYLQSLKVPAKKFPTTGQDASLVGLQNVISNYQCGTVYKPIYQEAQAAAALALYLRAGETPPPGLVNGKSQDTQANVSVPSVLLNPIWVTPQNVKSTVIADQFVQPSQLCAGQFASDCSALGIS